MLDVRRLRLLRELAYRGTIAAVAEALAYTPSAVSQQLSALEREAGVPLLARSGRRVTLTPAGRLLVGHAEAVLERLERATAELAATRAELAGPLRIGAFPTAGRQLLPAALAILARDHPRLEPMVDEVDPADVPDRLRAGDLDVALIHEYTFVPAEPDRDRAVPAEPLLEEPMYLAAPAGPAADPGPDPLRWAASEPWIVNRPGTLCYAMTIRACQAAGFTPRIRHRVDDFTTVLALVAAGQGVALVPQLAIAEPPAGVSLTELPMRRRTCAAYRRGAGQHPAVAALVSALRTASPYAGAVAA
ncbi:MAG TPA: LysR family transcriptional regulator [Natronosporangium sp.]